MSETNNLKTTVESLMKGMDGLVSSKTVVGDAVRVDNITILPLIDVSFGIGAGSNLSDKKDKGMGGVGGKITPSAVLVIKDGITRVLPVAVPPVSTVDRVVEMVPEVMDRVTNFINDRQKKKEEAAGEAAEF